MKQVVVVVRVTSRSRAAALRGALKLQRQLNNLTNTSATLLEIAEDRSIQLDGGLVMTPAECATLSALAAFKTLRMRPTTTDLSVVLDYSESTIGKALRILKNLHLADGSPERPYGYQITAKGTTVLREIVSPPQSP